MASETVDPIDWSHPPPYTGQYPLSSTYCTLQCGLQITRLTALSQRRSCDVRNARPTHCLCGHSGSHYTMALHNQNTTLHFSVRSNGTTQSKHYTTLQCSVYWHYTTKTLHYISVLGLMALHNQNKVDPKWAKNLVSFNRPATVDVRSVLDNCWPH